MTEGFEAVQAGDGRVFVVLHPGCAVSQEEILDLLAQAGVDPSNVTFVSPEETAELSDLGDASVVIPLNADSCEAPELEVAGRHCGQAGGSVIVVIEKGFAYPELHPIAEKYGTQSSWSADDLGRCISGGTAATPNDSEGKPLRRSGAKQVNC
jgi:hypothetical protein